MRENAFSPNSGKYGKNTDYNNSEYEYFLRSEDQLKLYLRNTVNLDTTRTPLNNGQIF